MNKILVLLSLSLLFVLWNIKTDNPYTFRIQKGKISRQGKQTFYTVTTTLNNNTADTLKYYSMLCAWQIFYTDHKGVKPEMVMCDKETVMVLTLAPKQNKITTLKLMVNKSVSTSTKFRVGFNLLKAKQWSKNIYADFDQQWKHKNIIWSNPIEM